MKRIIAIVCAFVVSNLFCYGARADQASEQRMKKLLDAYTKQHAPAICAPTPAPVVVVPTPPKKPRSRPRPQPAAQALPPAPPQPNVYNINVPPAPAPVVHTTIQPPAPAPNLNLKDWVTQEEFTPVKRDVAEIKDKVNNDLVPKVNLALDTSNKALAEAKKPRPLPGWAKGLIAAAAIVGTAALATGIAALATDGFTATTATGRQ